MHNLVYGVIANNRSDKRTRREVQQLINWWADPTTTVIIEKQLRIHLQIQPEH